MSRARTYLQKLILQWEEQGRLDERERYPFQALMDEVLFYADLRFKDYMQYKNEGDFPTRLRKWLDNVTDARHKRSLFQLLAWLTFVDRSQMRSLYRDAYRRIIVPWVSRGVLTVSDCLSQQYDQRLRNLLQQYSLFSITESFDFPAFRHVNDLSGLRKPRILGEDPRHVASMLPPQNAAHRGAIILEDFVGTGKQARAVLVEVVRQRPEWAILFVPLIILDSGLTSLRTDVDLQALSVGPVVAIGSNACLPKQPSTGEPPEFKAIRSVVRSTALRVLAPLGSHDDPPKDPFGYGGCGALLVTCHNTPNNTLPLIHHRSPTWFALFRRVHYSKDALR